MISVRCKMAVEAVLESAGINYVKVELGRVEISGSLTPEQYVTLKAGLRHYELEILDSKKEILVERVKNIIVSMIRNDSRSAPIKFTVHLSETLGYDYTYLANLFSESEGKTIERFYIFNRIERVKELMIYEKMSIKEIVYQLNYSSLSHLCLQFKKVTGETPSSFRKMCESPEYLWKK